MAVTYTFRSELVLGLVSGLITGFASSLPTHRPSNADAPARREEKALGLTVVVLEFWTTRPVATEGLRCRGLAGLVV